MRHQDVSLLIIGAGPAGLAASTSSALYNNDVWLVDDNPLPGGQIWRQDIARQPSKLAQFWLTHAKTSHLTLVNSAKVITPLDTQTLLVETTDETLALHYKRLILATGARERFLPFPGWTLPNIMGAGGLQALVKSGLPIQNKRVVVAGSGPLLLAVASYLKSKGALISALVEQAPWPNLIRFGLSLPRFAKQFRQAASFGQNLLGISYHAGTWINRAYGTQQLTSVTLHNHLRQWTIPCDYLAYGFGLVPNHELAIALGCSTLDNAVQVNEWQQSSLAHIYCAGEITGIGGLDAALAEGQIAGLSACDQKEEARKHFSARTQARLFANILAETFQLRPELKLLADPDTIVCRCEDVSYQEIQPQKSWRSAKLQTRCGMGNCQGRICGTATDFLFGWSQDSLRTPLVPTNINNLILQSPNPEPIVQKETIHEN